MIHGIGVDLVEVARMRRALGRFGERFAERLLSEGELAAFREAPKPDAFLAKRFAAKEAALKALGTGLRKGLSWHQVEVRHDEAGRPLLGFSGRALELADAAQVAETHLSLSDEREYAVAFVTLVRR